MQHLTRRKFLAAGVGGLATVAGIASANDQPQSVSFIVIGDTHYLANRERPAEMDAASRTVTSRLVEQLNRLPGTAIAEAAGGGTVRRPQGVIHVGDVIDSGDKNGRNYEAMQRTEWQRFVDDFGLTGRDGQLRYPVYEVHGNHDSPRGDGFAVGEIRRRNRNRPGLVNVSENGLHYSWDWGPVHFVNLGIVVGSVPEPARRRRYNPLDSLPFLRADLARHVRDRSKPVILTHHIDVSRYSTECNEQPPPGNPEWDPCDVRGYYEAIRGYNVIGVMYGHTHARNVFRWDGTRNMRAQDGIPIFNTNNVSHFHTQHQAFFYCEVTHRELVVREFATRDGWQTGIWTPSVWRIPLRRG